MNYWTANGAEQRLQTFLLRWVNQHAGFAHEYDQNTYALKLRTAEAIADDLLASAEFREVGLASFLRSPDGQLIRAVVGRVLPGPSRVEFNLLVDAIEIAADASQSDRRVLALLGTIAALSLVAVLFANAQG